MAVVRGFLSLSEGVLSEPIIERRSRVVEPELDMARPQTEPNSSTGRLRGIVRWLTTGNHRARRPMRSVARELEETWPSGER